MVYLNVHLDSWVEQRLNYFRPKWLLWKRSIFFVNSFYEVWIQLYFQSVWVTGGRGTGGMQMLFKSKYSYWRHKKNWPACCKQEIILSRFRFWLVMTINEQRNLQIKSHAAVLQRLESAMWVCACVLLVVSESGHTTNNTHTHALTWLNAFASGLWVIFTGLSLADFINFSPSRTVSHEQHKNWKKPLTELGF